MKSYKEMSNEAKNRKRSKPSGKIHTSKTKKPKHIPIECRYVGAIDGDFIFLGHPFFNPEWHHYWTKYNKLQDAENAVKALNHKEKGRYEYRLKPEE